MPETGSLNITLILKILLKAATSGQLTGPCTIAFLLLI